MDIKRIKQKKLRKEIDEINAEHQRQRQIRIDQDRMMDKKVLDFQRKKEVNYYHWLKNLHPQFLRKSPTLRSYGEAYKIIFLIYSVASFVFGLAFLSVSLPSYRLRSSCQRAVDLLLMDFWGPSHNTVMIRFKCYAGP